MDGTEIVQVYVSKVSDTDGPLKTLKGFKRVNVKSYESVNAFIELPYDSFEFFDRDKVEMAINPGEYEVLYGNSSDSRDLKIAKILIK